MCLFLSCLKVLCFESKWSLEIGIILIMCISYLSFSVKSPQPTATRLLSEASALTFLLDDNVTKVNPGHVWPSLGAVWYADKLSILPVPRAYLKEPRSQIPAMLCKIHHAFSISSHPEVLHGLLVFSTLFFLPNHFLLYFIGVWFYPVSPFPDSEAQEPTNQVPQGSN